MLYKLNCLNGKNFHGGRFNTVMNTQNTGIQRAFTLIELLIVVAIISILASIAVPNFLEAQVRAKVAATKADMRTMATAIETYAIDNNTYPRRTVSNGTINADVNSSSFKIFADGQRRLEDLKSLTTPISYLGTLPRDLFETTATNSTATLPWNSEDNLIDYWSPLAAHELAQGADLVGNTTFSQAVPWILVSVGPDLIVGQDLQTARIPNFQQASSARTYRNEYDATNGTVSSGNVYRLRTQKSAQEFFNVNQFPTP